MFEKNYADKIRKLSGDSLTRYLEDEVARDLTYPHQLSKLILDVVRNTSKHSNWVAALKIAEMSDDEGVWDTLTYELKGLSGKSKQSLWLTEYIKQYAQNVKVTNYNLDSVLTVFLRTDSMFVYMKYVQDKFDIEETYRGLASIVLQISPDVLKVLISKYNDWKFIEALYYGKISTNMEKVMLSKALRQVGTSDLQNFSSFDLEWLMKNHPEPFKDVNVINSACAAFKKKNSSGAATLLTNFIMEGPFKDDSKISWLWGMYDVEGMDKNSDINKALYELTGKDEYLSDEAKDIFLF